MTQPDYIPKEFWAALEQQPDCFTLRSAIADRLEELELYDYAECIRWSIAKKVVPDNGWWFTKDYALLLPEFLMGIRTYTILDDIYPSYSITTVQVRAFLRLVWRWSMLSQTDKATVWNWEPSTGVSK